jgi:hypothetical protein
MASIRYRQNNIARFVAEDGRVVSSHEEKEAILWHAFKQRLGVATQPVVPPELLDRVSSVHDLHSLSDNFSEKEIYDVVASRPSDTAPGRMVLTPNF